MMCCQGLVRVKTLSAEFWTYWSLSGVLLGTTIAVVQTGGDEGVNDFSATESESDGWSLAMFYRWKKADLVIWSGMRGWSRGALPGGGPLGVKRWLNRQWSGKNLQPSQVGSWGPPP